MIVHKIDPVLFNLGIIDIRYYSLVYIFGFLLGYYLLHHYVKKSIIKNLDSKKIDNLIIWMIISVIVGSRLGHVLFYDPGYYFSNPIKILFLWEGGMSFHGGLIAIIITGILFCKKHNIRFYSVADMFAVYTPFILFFGRIANFINGELWGTKTNVPWCVQFQNVEGCRHPSQIYEAIKNIVIFPFLLWLYPKKRKDEGFTFWTFIALYGVFRFFINFYREPEPSEFVFLGISMGQYLSLIMFIVASIVIVSKYYVKNKSSKVKIRSKEIRLDNNS